MKKLLGTLLLTAMAVTTFAQTNGGVELWDSILGTPPEPQKFITANLFKVVDVTNPVSVTRITGSSAAAGTTSMKIKTIKLNTNPSQGLVNDTCGIAMQGSVTFNPNPVLVDRVPYTARPQSFHFVYQYIPVSIDSMIAYVELTKWNTSLSRRDTVAWFGLVSHTPVSSWTVASGPLLYFSNHPNMFPDSLAIVFSSSATHPRIGSELWIDDIYFTGTNSTNDIYSKANLIKTFPNPAKDNITISADLDNANAVVIYDGIGQIVGTYQLENKKYILNTGELRAGNYYFSILDKSGVVITGNTFSVVK